MVKFMKYTSLWMKDEDKSNIKELNKNLNVDILIIGGGITGLTTLYNLRNSNLKITLVDASLIGHGVSGNTTGKINYLQELTYQEIVKKHSLDVAKLYLESQKSATKFITDIINSEKIKCDLTVTDSYVYTNKEEEIEKIKLEKKILTNFGINVEEYIGNIDKIESKYAIKVNDTYVFHPLKYLNALKNICLKAGKEIFENTKIINIKKENKYYICETSDYQIKTKKVILACHYPFFLFPYFMPKNASIEKSYIGASLKEVKNYTLITAKNPCTSIRFHKDKEEYMIYLTKSSNICNNIDEKENFNALLRDLKKLKLNPEYVWKNDDLLTVDKLPYIGYIQRGNNNLLIGTGFNTWGMTNGTLAGMILSDLVLGYTNKYANMCNPLRVNNISNIGSFLINIGSSIKGFIESKIPKVKKWYSSNVSFENINGKNIGIYKEGNKIYKVYNSCPHMGCSLIFNEKEKTWDCPCHASRFDINGKCIKGPSNYDISIKK